MAEAIARRPVLYWLIALFIGVLVGVVVVDQVSAAPAPPGAVDVMEQNLDGEGNIKVHEQGVVPITDNSGSLTVDDGGSSLAVEVLSAPSAFAVTDELLWERTGWAPSRTRTFTEDVYATAIHLFALAGRSELTMWDDDVRVARFWVDPDSPINLSLPHPIKFDEVEIECRSGADCFGQLSIMGYSGS